MMACEIRGLRKDYRGRPAALDGVDLTIDRRQLFGICGPNGAGKTTLVKCLLGLVRPGDGAMRVLGGSPDDVAIRARIGYLPERPVFPERLTVAALLRSIARIKRCGLDDHQLQAALARTSTAWAASMPLGVLSKGNRQRVAIAGALLGAPDLLILDEPTDGLDPDARVELRRELRREVARGGTVVINSHDLSEVEQTCGRVAIMIDGRVVRTATIGDLCTSDGWWARFSGPVDAPVVRAAGFLADDHASGTWRFNGDGAALNAALDRLRCRGIGLHELRPQRLTLEEAVLATIAERREGANDVQRAKEVWHVQ